MAATDTEAFVTLATNDTYSIGCLTLGSSLRRVRTSRKLAVMITSGVSQSMRNQLNHVFDVVQEVDLLDSNDPVNLQLLGRPDLNVTFTKLHCWCLTQFTKCVFLDADTLVLQNVDELFEREELSAAPDAGWPDCFNSGVFVYRPSMDTYQSLLQFAITQGSFDGGDQGLLNLFFGDWSSKDISKHLPFIYNVVSQAFYSYLPAFTKFKDNVKIVHFIGAVKPWNHTYNTVTRTVTPLPGTGHSQEFLQVWWTIFMEDVQGCLSPELTPELNIEHHLSNNQDSHSSFSSNQNREALPDYPPPSETYFILYPFVPPSLEHVYYTPPITSSVHVAHNTHESSVQSPEHQPPSSTQETFPSQDPGAVNPSEARRQENEQFLESVGAESLNDNNDNEPKVVEIKETTGRPYMHFETHYSEDPLSGIATEEPAKVLYSAKEFGKMTNKQSEKIQGINKQFVEPKQASPVKEVNTQERGPAGDLSTAKDNSREAILAGMAGVVGDLASIHISGGLEGGAGIQLSDEERKLAWEKGQIDYLGRDSFANIQRKLDATINAGAAEPVVLASQAPFPRQSPPKDSATPSSTPTVAKVVATASITPAPAAAVPLPKPVATAKTSITITSKAIGSPAQPKPKPK